MITFSKLGRYGRLGNQLFQYAYLREMADRMGVYFWCPEWDGDHIFDLGDAHIRSKEQPKKFGALFDQGQQAGYSADALEIKDDMEIQGYFQSEKYYRSPNLIKNWYKFKSNITESTSNKFDVDLTDRAVSISLRLDSDYAKTREFFPLYPAKYYSRALNLINDAERILVFSDRIDLAKKFVLNIKTNLPFVFVNELNPAEQLWLMTQCGLGNILTNSTFAWWGGYLNKCEHAKIIAPMEWVRPNVPVPISEILPEKWLKISSLHPFWDDFRVWRLTHPFETSMRVLNKFKNY